MAKQKKLMILGGSSFALPVIEAAHKLGVYVITCDYLTDNIAHKYSDEYCNVSIIDKDAVLKAARKLEIDGITSFACDPGVTTAAYVAEEMGLPNVGPYKSVCILQNKGKFRQFLKEHNFNVPWSKAYKNIDDALSEDPSAHCWPIIVKPTDSAGSKGVKKVDKQEDLKEAIGNALNSSISKEFIIEEFIEKRSFSFGSGSDSFSKDGELVFFSSDDQWFDKDAKNPYVPSAQCWPTSMPADVELEIRNEVQRLLKLLDMNTSIYNIEYRIGTNNKAYIMELSPRGGGNRLCEVIRYGTGVDLITAIVQHSVGLPINNIQEKPFDGNWTQVVLHSNKEGIIKDIRISDKIANNIVDKQLYKNIGDQVKKFNGANDLIGSLIMRFNSREEMLNVLENQDKYIEIVVE